ncbi:MAG: rRNA maturation RNase YbeY [Saprospiraceae bacterium]|nr:rRNA maturation RNase YbeY [Saprospiraceae bacterium]
MNTQKIAFLNEGISFFLPYPEQTQDWLIKVIENESSSLGELTYIFCSDNYLHKINLEHLKHDTLTDVITFQYSENKAEGDIFISVERTNANATYYNVDPLSELYRVMVHGLLHLLGYKDKTPEDKAMMTKKEDFYLDLLNEISSSN